MSDRVRIFGPDDGEHLDLVREGGEVRFTHYKMLPVNVGSEQLTWAEVAMVTMDWGELLKAIDKLKGGDDDDRRTQIQGQLFKPTDQ